MTFGMFDIYHMKASIESKCVISTIYIQLFIYIVTDYSVNSNLIREFMIIKEKQKFYFYFIEKKINKRSERVTK